MTRDAINDEILKIDREIEYKDYDILPVITKGGFQAKILYHGQVIATTRQQPNQGLMEIDAKQIIKKLAQTKPIKKESKTMESQNDKTGRDLINAKIQSMPKFEQPTLEDNETTIKQVSKDLNVSPAIAKNRLERLAKQGLVTKSKRRNAVVYTWVSD
jgi:hypothetical protein